MTPQIGDEVVVHYTVRKDMVDGFVVLGQSDRVESAVGTLGVELDGAGRLAGIVIEDDGGATFIARSAVLSMEVLS